jgi:FkbM family methyltransferase
MFRILCSRVPVVMKQAMRRQMLSIVRGLSGQDGPSTGVHSIPLQWILQLLYPSTSDWDGLLAAAEYVLPQGTVTSTADLRVLLNALDRQTWPSPVSIRFRQGDVVVSRLDGYTMIVDRADGAVSQLVERERMYEPHVTAALKAYCSAGMTVLDVGANIGYHTLALSRLVGETGSVFAVEPNSENCRLILASLRENGFENVQLIPMALDSKRGWAYYTSHVGSNGGLVDSSAKEYVEAGGWVVPTVTLDEMVQSRVDLIKIDVEGAEGRVVNGASKTIE